MRTTVSIALRLAVVAALSPLAAACSSAGTAAPASSTGTPAVVRADESDAGGTTAIAVGSSLLVTLHSTYWRFTPPEPVGILRAATAQYHPSHRGPRFPGSGAGTVTAVFTGLARGTATVVATRLSCGEALRCAPGEGEYRLTVVVR